jgi:hypothetical protein
VDRADSLQLQAELAVLPVPLRQIAQVEEQGNGLRAALRLLRGDQAVNPGSEPGLLPGSFIEVLRPGACGLALPAFGNPAAGLGGGSMRGRAKPRSSGA